MTPPSGRDFPRRENEPGPDQNQTFATKSDAVVAVFLGIFFGVFVTGMGLYLVRGALKRIGWI